MTVSEYVQALQREGQPVGRVEPTGPTSARFIDPNGAVICTRDDLDPEPDPGDGAEE